ncbi:MAG: hypothetical protein ABR541_06645 [Candidatus Dormibacteria bacterium]
MDQHPAAPPPAVDPVTTAPLSHGAVTDPGAGESGRLRRRRSPGVASGLSVIPGLGQLYNLQPGKALFFLPAALLPTVVLSLGFSWAARRLGPSLLNRGDGALFPFVVLLGVIVFLGLFILGLTFWASAVVDARRSAEDLSTGRQPSGRWWLLRF